MDPYTELVMLTASMSHIGHAVNEELNDTLAGQWARVVLNRLRIEAATAFVQDEEENVKDAVEVIVAGVNDLVSLLPPGVAQSHARWTLTLVSDLSGGDGVEQSF